MEAVKLLTKLTRPFTIVVEPDIADAGWVAKVVGPDINFITCADDPAVAVFMAWDTLRMFGETSTDVH